VKELTKSVSRLTPGSPEVQRPSKSRLVDPPTAQLDVVEQHDRHVVAPPRTELGVDVDGGEGECDTGFCGKPRDHRLGLLAQVAALPGDQDDR